MKRFKPILLLSVIALLAMSLVLPSCALKTGPTPEATKPSAIRVMSIQDLTGPYASIVGPAKLAGIDALSYVNTELGGVDGVNIVCDICDYEGKAEMIVPCYQKQMAMEPKPLLMGSMDTAVGLTLHDRLIEEGLIGFATASEAIYPYGNTFGLHCAYPTMFAMFIDFALAKWKEAGKTGKPKLAIFGWDTAYGRSSVNASLKTYLQGKVDLVGEYYHPVSQLDITPYVADAKSKGADIVYNTSSMLSGMAQAKAMKEQGWTPFMAGAWGIDQNLLYQVGEALEGWYTPCWLAEWGEIDENPSVKKANDIFVKAGRSDKKDRGLYYLQGFNSPVIIRMIIADTVARAGWDKLTAAEMKKTILGYTKPVRIAIGDGQLCYWGGLSRTDYQPNRARIYQVQKDPKQWLGSFRIYPVTDFISKPNIVSDKMKETGRD